MTMANIPDVYLNGVIKLSGAAKLNTVSVSFPDHVDDTQTATQEAAPLGWCNSASIELNRKDDAVTVDISAGDPRGAFTMTIRRLPDGTLMLFVPDLTDGAKHMAMTQVRPGAYEIR